MKKMLPTLLFLAMAASSMASMGGKDPDLMEKFDQGASNILFLENRGQVLNQYGNPRPDILFMSRNGGMKVALSANGISYQFEKSRPVAPSTGSEATIISKDESIFPEIDIPEKTDVETYRLDMHLLGANPSPVVVKEAPQTYFENYYNIPSAPDGILGVKSYQRITMLDVYPGIDWVIYTKGEVMEYDFVVHPGVDPSLIKMKYDGAVELNLNEQGGLVAKTPLGEITEAAPISFSSNQSVASQFKLENGVLSFALGAYDHNQSITIDPTLIWATYYGAAGDDQCRGTITDASGNVYLAGFTTSTTAISSGGHQNAFGGGNDAILVKFNASGARLWATYYGGASGEIGFSTATDAMKNVYLAGWTYSTSSIAFNGYDHVYEGVFTNAPDAFLVKFDSSGVRQWGTYYGGSSQDVAYSTATDPSGNVYLAGATLNSSDIAFNGHSNVFGGGINDAFLVKFNSAGNRLWATYYGGSGNDGANGTATDALGNVYLVGATNSTNAIAASGHQGSLIGGSDAFIVKFNAAGSRQWGTYYGGNITDHAASVATDASGNVYVGGETLSDNGIASGGHQNSRGGLDDAFLAKFNAQGTRIWGTYCGGSGIDKGIATAIDALGNVYLAGFAESTNGIASGGHQNTLGGVQDAFLVKFDPAGLRQWGTYYGGASTDIGQAVATDATGNVYLGGQTASTNAIASGGFQNINGSGGDAFLAKFQDFVPAAITCPGNITLSNATGLCSSLATFNATAIGSPAPTTTYSQLSGTSFPVGSTIVTITATNQSNTATCAFTVTVTDAEAPTITCPVNSSVSAGVGTCSAVVTYTLPAATDNCTGASTLQTAGLPSGSTFPVGSTTTTFEATDANGNSASCSFTVTVTDAEAPTITCPGNTSVSAGVGTCSAVVTYAAPSATDNCGAASISQIAGFTSGSAFPVGTTTNTFEAIDAHGQTSTCSFTVNVVDAEAPTITCPASLSVSASVGVCGAVVVFSAPTGADNCNGASTVQTMGTTSGATFPVGITTNTYVVTDGHGQTATCSFTVTVTDVEAPTMTCPANITMNIDSVHCEVPVTWAAPTVQDNCGAGTLSSNYSSGDLFSSGTRTVTYTVTDQGGNTDTCAFTVTIHQPAFALYVAVYTHAGGANTSCHGVNDGEAGAYPSGGCLPYDYLWSTGQMNQSITGLAPGGYWVTVTDGQGNMAWDTVTIIEALPVATPFITFTQGGPVACQGDTIGLIGPSGAISYNWSNGSSTIGTQVTGSGMISLNIFDQFGCPGVDSVSMTFHPSPTSSISQSGNILSSTSAVTYQWYLNGGMLPGATQQTHVATQSGTYTVVVTDANGCEGTSNPLAVTIVGLDEAQFDPNLQVFPNPFGSAFTVELDLPEPLEVTATVYALHGAIVWQSRSAGEVQRYAQTIPTHDIAAGTYYLRIQAGEHLIVRKVVKQ